MKLKTIIKKAPLIVSVYRRIKKRQNQKVLRQLDASSCPQAKQLLKVMEKLNLKLPSEEQSLIERIEYERITLLNRNELLNDGRLGEGGLYDEGVSVKTATEASKPPVPALMLYLLVREMKPKNVIELGTNVGISSAYIGAALKVNGEGGKITTLESSPYRINLAREIHQKLKISNISYIEGLFADTLASSCSQIGPIDLSFIDGHHQYQPTLDYYEEIFRFSTDQGVFVFDDIRWSNGMKDAWLAIQSDTRFGLLADLYTVGICIQTQKSDAQRHVLPTWYVF